MYRYIILSYNSKQLYKYRCKNFDELVLIHHIDKIRYLYAIPKNFDKTIFYKVKFYTLEELKYHINVLIKYDSSSFYKECKNIIFKFERNNKINQIINNEI